MVKDAVDYSQIVARAEMAVRKDRRLPEQVFQAGYGHFRFLEFDRAMSGSFWELITRLAIAAGDSRIDTLVLDPDAAGYYHKHFGCYGAIELSTSASAEEYCARLAAPFEDSPADALLFHADVAVWISESCRWAAWGERGTEMAILGFRDDFAPPVEQSAADCGLKLFSLAEMLTGVLPVAFTGGVIPAEFERGLQQNYGG
jgi:hypothetical protein